MDEKLISDRRLATSVSDAVEEAIHMHENGEIAAAMKLLSQLGLSPNNVHRILTQASQRRNTKN
jgi:hypothetical protein